MSAQASPPEVRETVAQVGPAEVRLLAAGHGNEQVGHVVIAPGLGTLGYLLPTVRAVAGRGLRCTLLDLPGFGSRSRAGTAPTIPDVAEAVARYVDTRPVNEPVVVAGHSTGAQAALLAAVRLGPGPRPVAVVLAGPTVAPEQRSVARLVRAAPWAYRRERAGELVVLPDLLRGRSRVWTMLRSGIQDRPEEHIRRLERPLLLTAGRCDAFAPSSWLTRLAAAAERSPCVRIVRLPGSHNNPYTFPGPLSALLVAGGRPATWSASQARAHDAGSASPEHPPPQREQHRDQPHQDERRQRAEP